MVESNVSICRLIFLLYIYYMLFSYQTCYIMWHFRLRIYIPWGATEVNIYRVVTSARPCNKVGHLFWFTLLAQHETDDVILYIRSVHKHRGNSFKLQNYKMRLKRIRLNWINSMQVKKILFTNVFFPDYYAC
jgi:hypothetical protein